MSNIPGSRQPQAGRSTGATTGTWLPIILGLAFALGGSAAASPAVAATSAAATAPAVPLALAAGDATTMPPNIAAAIGGWYAGTVQNVIVGSHHSEQSSRLIIKIKRAADGKLQLEEYTGGIGFLDATRPQPGMAHYVITRVAMVGDTLQYQPTSGGSVILTFGDDPGKYRYRYDNGRGRIYLGTMTRQPD